MIRLLVVILAMVAAEVADPTLKNIILYVAAVTILLTFIPGGDHHGPV